MDTSIFLNRLSRRFPIPLLAIEYYSKFISEDLEEEVLNDRVTVLLKDLCGVVTPTADDVAYLLERLKELSNTTESPQQANTNKLKRTLGFALNSWLDSTTPVELLGEMTGYNPVSMQELYCKTDFSETQSLMRAFVQGVQSKLFMSYESSLYAAGNRYAGDKSSDTNTRRFDANSKEGLAALSAFGVGTINLGDLPKID